MFYFENSPDRDRTEIFNDYLSVNFNKLDSVESFSKYIITALNPDSKNVSDQSNLIDIDSGAIKEKKNFLYMSNMTYLITFLLIVFAVLSISLFISNILRSHLSKVKMNIGTYKAFGLSDNESKNIYLSIMLRFIVISLIGAFVIAFALSFVLNIWLTGYFKVEGHDKYFALFESKTYGFIALIITITLIVSYVNINKILSKTPGDLIYNR